MKITIDIDGLGDDLKVTAQVEANTEEFVELAKKSADEDYDSIFHKLWIKSGYHIDKIIGERSKKAPKQEEEKEGMNGDEVKDMILKYLESISKILESKSQSC